MPSARGYLAGVLGWRSATSHEGAGLSTDRRPPGWFDLVVRSVAFAVVSLGLVGLPLALLGQFRPLPLAAGALVVFVLLSLLWRHGQRDQDPRPRPSRSAHIGAVLALLIGLASAAVNVANHSDHLLVDGDPAVYAVTGTLLARTGELTVPTQVDELFAGNETIMFTGAGYFATEGEPTVYPQFFHLLPVLLAVGHWVGGVELLLVVNPLLGAAALLALYAFAARLVRPPWALLATASVAVLLPQLHFTRDNFSEIPSQLLVFAGLALLWDVTGAGLRRRGGPPLAAGLTAGLVLGGSAMARIDAFLYLVPFAVGLLLLRAGRTGLGVMLGLALTAAVALADGYLGSPVYLESVRGPLLQTAAALVLVAVAGVLLRRPPEWVPRLGARLAVPVALLVVALAAFAWFVRPYVQTARKIPDRTNATIAGLQQKEGLPVDVPRSYDEQTMVWLSWYLGPPALALGLLALAYLTYRLLRGRDLRLAPFVLLVGLVTAVYLWHPGIFPVHYWASRRFLPVTFPGLVLLAVLLCALLWERIEHRALKALPALAAVSVLAFPLALLPGATLPRSYGGLVGAFEQLCETLLPEDVVLIIGERAPIDVDDPKDTYGAGAETPKGSLPQAVQGYCGVAAGSTTYATRTEDVEQIAAAAQGRGHRLVLLSRVPDPPDVPAGADFRPVFDVTVPTTALSLSKRPYEIYPYRVRIFAAVL